MVEVAERLNAILTRQLGACVPDLFGAYGLELEAVLDDSAPRLPYGFASITGFVGELSGTLLLGTSSSVLCACHPARAETNEISDPMLLDWVAELGNQLTGRLRSRLRTHAIGFESSPPISIMGDRMRYVARAGETFRAGFRSDAGEVCVYIDAKIAESVASRAEFFADPPSYESAEGKVILF